MFWVSFECLSLKFVAVFFDSIKGTNNFASLEPYESIRCKFIILYIFIFILSVALKKPSCKYPGGGTPRKIGWGWVARFAKPLPYSWPKSAIFPSLFSTWLKIRYPVYDHCGWHSCPKHNLWRAFADGLIDNDKIIFKTRAQKSYPISDQTGQNRYPIYDQNGWKTAPFGGARMKYSSLATLSATATS